ncbi:MAG: hypothetical protein WC304_00585 [Candidatus Gracilibacteria bacterium]|jgi:uncharacterized membrane protein
MNKEDSEILEGEVVSEIPHAQHEKKSSRNYSPLLKLVKLKSNCAIGCFTSLALTVIAIATGSWLVFLLALLLPAWLAAQQR